VKKGKKLRGGKNLKEGGYGYRRKETGKEEGKGVLEIQIQI
jgi:hypothetical protein